MMANEDKKVHVDLLDIDMKAGAHWLSPAQKNRDSEEAKAIREKHRAKWLAKQKTDPYRKPE